MYNDVMIARLKIPVVKNLSWPVEMTVFELPVATTTAVSTTCICQLDRVVDPGHSTDISHPLLLDLLFMETTRLWWNNREGLNVHLFMLPTDHQNCFVRVCHLEQSILFSLVSIISCSSSCYSAWNTTNDVRPIWECSAWHSVCTPDVTWLLSLW